MDLMEFSMTEGNDTLTGDENFLPPQLTQTPVVVNSILKPSTKGNLMQLHTPKPQPKNLKVKFETPHSVKKVTPTRYEQIADLDEKENWIERTTIVTKTDHNLNIEYAKDILNNVVENLPLSKSATTVNKPGNESDDEETFFDAKEETEKATSDICRHPASGPDITPPVPQQTIDSTPATQQVDHALPMSVVSGATGILDVSMECAETDDLRNEEKMECDETVIDTTVICNNTLIENKAVGEEMIQDNPVTMVTSPPLQASKGAYTIDFDNLDSCNPFHSKSAVSNSPVFNVETHGKVDSKDKIVPEEVPIQSGKEESVFDSQILEGLLDIKAEAGADLLSEMLPDVEVKGVYNIDFDDKADPFATKSQVKNSPVSAKPVQTQLQAHDKKVGIDKTTVDDDPFSMKCGVSNSPVLNVETHGKVDSTDKLVSEEVPIQSGKEESVFDSQILEGLLDIKAEAGADLLSEVLPDVEVKGVYNIDFDDKADPFATKSQVKNSPVSAKPVQTQLQAHDKDVSIEETTVDDDPFSTKSNVVNSPIQATVLGNSNPFATKANVCNSPILPPVDRSSGCSQLQNSDEKDDVEQLSSKSDSATLPLPESNMIRSSTSFVSSDVLNSSNPFLTKTNVVNSPMPGASVIEGNPLISYNKKSPGSLEILKTANTQSDEEKTEDLKLHEPGLSTRTSSSHVLTASESAVKGICDNDSNTDKYSAPAKEEQDGTMLLLGNDPSTLKSDASNSPLPSTTLRNDPLADLDPFTTKSKVPNSPAPPATSAEDPIIDPFTTKSKVANSPAHSATSAEDPMFDPFTTKAKVANSPAPSATSAEDPMSDPFTTKSKVANSPAPSATSLEDPMSDPFTTKSKVVNSPAPSATSAEDPMSDPFTTKSKVANSPAPSETSAEDPMSDPFTTKSKVANSPAPSATSAEDPMSDPFTTKAKVANSPAPSATSAEDKMSDPFTTKAKVANSPAPSATSAEDPMSDPFTTKSKVANSPAPSATSAEDPMSDPFTTKAKVANSPAPSATSAEDTMSDPFTTKAKVANSPAPSATSAEDTMSDPFTTKSKVANSPAPSATSAEDPMSDPFTTKAKVANSPAPSATSAEDPMSDPFTTKAKVANSPAPSATSAEDSMSDPFTTKSKVANSPAHSAANSLTDPFATKSKVSNSPSHQAPSSEVPNLPSQTVHQGNGPSSSGNETTEAKLGSRNVESAGSVPDFSEEEFRPATECIFNDTGFLDVLEKFGSSNNESKVSDLARMSLYVKFDPLVDLPASDPRRASTHLLKRASILNMPRRSLSGKSLSDVCNSEENMLLMGTPPKQLSQHLANLTSRSHHTGFTPGSIPTTPKAFKPQLDLLCANTPPRSVKKSTTPAPVKPNSNLPEDPVDNLAGGSDDNIVEVLQYTDKDMCEMKTSLFLEFQGQKLLLDREWNKVVDKLKAKIEEQNQTLENKQADIKLIGNFSKELENIVEGLIQEKESTKTVTEELQKERDQAVQDTQSLEKAFSELHRRNENLKEALSGYVKNQEILTSHAKELQKTLTAVKTESKEKVTELTQQLAKAKSDLNLLTTSSEARARRDKLQLESLQKTVDQKMSENKELTQMCDDLLAKVSS